MLSRAGTIALYDPAVRALVLAICLFGCKKHENQEPAPPPPAEPSRGHSFTPYKDGGTLTGSGDEASGSGSAVAATDAAPTADARLYGGDGSPAFRDESGRVHGPGGPVYMGKGVPCDASRDHCMRDGVWFAADSVRPGSLFRAVPAFQLEGKWFNWRGGDADPGKLFKTELATIDTIKTGAPVVFLVPETSSNQWLESEYEALTTSRWDVAYVDAVNRSAKTFRVKGWPDDLPVDVARVITEQTTH